MLLVGEGLDIGRLVFVVDSAFSSISIDVCEFVDLQGMFLIEGYAV